MVTMFQHNLPIDGPLVLPSRWRKPPDERGAPCSFRANGLTFISYAVAKTWYEQALSWRYEMGSMRTSLRYNRRCLAAFCMLHHPRPRWAYNAARAGMERAIWELSGKIVKLRKRPRRQLPPAQHSANTVLHFVERPLFHVAHPNDGYQPSDVRCAHCAVAVNRQTGQQFLLWQHDGVHWSLSRHDPAYNSGVRFGDIELVGEPPQTDGV